MCDTLKTAGRRAKTEQNFGLMAKHLVYTGYFLPFRVSVFRQSEVIRCISNFADFGQSFIWKSGARCANGLKFGPRGQVLSVCKVLLTVECSRSF